MTTELEKIRQVIAQTFATDFGEIKVLGIKVRPDVGFDDHDILRIWVVFEGEPEDVDTRRLPGVVRHVRPKLREIGQEAFPVISYISESDAKEAGFVLS